MDRDRHRGLPRRSEKRKSAGTTIESAAGSLKPWRKIVTPHRDVASGRYQQAEFAADLWQVHLGQGTDEYLDPVELFRRTYLTDSPRWDESHSRFETLTETHGVYWVRHAFDQSVVVISCFRRGGDPWQDEPESQST